ncbi:MAG: class I SAM-dependent methyltransferase [Deltaproteobacteria bacterium]|nr:class I SAM-dependent methyltransferase [Deltaproteobacteria bacterium]
MLTRIAEDKQVMDHVESVNAYDEGGKKGNLLPTYYLAADIICQLAPQEGHAVDIACGNGLLTLTLAQSLPNFKFLGLELSSTMLERAQENSKLFNKHVEFTQASMTDLSSIPSHSSDLTLITYALHHTDSEKDARSILSEINRITKKDGAIFIMDLIRPRSHMIYKFISKALGTKNPYLQKDFEASLRASYNTSEFRRLLESAGLTNLTYHRDLILHMAFRPHRQAQKNSPVFFNQGENLLKTKMIYNTSRLIFNLKKRLHPRWEV